MHGPFAWASCQKFLCAHLPNTKASSQKYKYNLEIWHVVAARQTKPSIPAWQRLDSIWRRSPKYNVQILYLQVRQRGDMVGLESSSAPTPLVHHIHHLGPVLTGSHGVTEVFEVHLRNKLSANSYISVPSINYCCL